MKKIPTLFERDFFDNHTALAKPIVMRGMEWVLSGEGIATVKWDGACCAIIGGKLYKRYDAKHGKPVPKGAVKCQAKPDPVTGHWPCWVLCSRLKPEDKWFWEACDNFLSNPDCYPATPINGTYEAIGKHFQGNPYGMLCDILIPHGKDIIIVERSYEGIKKYLSENYIEGIVFWKNGRPMCKIRRKDFGFEWNSQGGNSRK